MSSQRCPFSVSWGSLLVLPLVLLVVVVVLLALVSPREGEAQEAPTGRAANRENGLPYDHATMAPSVMVVPPDRVHPDRRSS
jgi:hypothetical protein